MPAPKKPADDPLTLDTDHGETLAMLFQELDQGDLLTDESKIDDPPPEATRA
jgi:hypothetical protein